MKKTLAFFSAAVLLAVLFTNAFGYKVSSLEELRAKAGDYCTGSANTDCRSSATGNIYPNMEAANW
jgi:hypothetical protein